MDKISFLYGFISRYKYYIVILIGTVLVSFVGENSLYRNLQLNFEISDLKAEIEKYNALYEADKKQLRDLERNPNNIERIARERYFMKADDEDIFVLSTDSRITEEETVKEENETTE